MAANVTKAETALADAKTAYDKVFKEVEANIKKVSEDYDYKDAIKDNTDNDYIKDTFANIQEKIKVKQAEYDAAKADYDAASAQLKALLAIFLK